MTNLHYMAWLDIDPKRTAAEKLAQGAARYAEHFGERPRVVLVNVADAEAQPPEGTRLQVVGYIRVHNYWFGMEGP